MDRLRAVLIGIAFAVMPTVAGAQSSPALNYQGLWWGGQEEAGWNLNLAHQGEIIFALWATHDAQGQPTWFSMTATQVGPTTYEGTLYRSTGPAFTQLAFDPGKVALREAGTATLVFNGDNEGQFTYRLSGGQSQKPIFKFAAAGRQPTCEYSTTRDSFLGVNLTDLWIASGQPGWAIALAHIHPGLLMATWFTYDADGSPTWFYGVADDFYGDFNGYILRASTAPGPVYGPAALTYTDISDLYVGQMTDGELFFDTRVKIIPQERTITRYVFRGKGTMCYP